MSGSWFLLLSKTEQWQRHSRSSARNGKEVHIQEHDRARVQLISEDQAVAPRILTPGGTWATRASQKEMGDSEPGPLSPEQNKTEGKPLIFPHELLAKGWKRKKKPRGSLGVSSTPGSGPVQLRACREMVTMGLSPGAWDENQTDLGGWTYSRADRVALLNCAPEIYKMLLTRVTPVRLIIKNKKKIIINNEKHRDKQK